MCRIGRQRREPSSDSSGDSRGLELGQLCPRSTGMGRGRFSPTTVSIHAWRRSLPIEPGTTGREGAPPGPRGTAGVGGTRGALLESASRSLARAWRAPCIDRGGHGILRLPQAQAERTRAGHAGGSRPRAHALDDPDPKVRLRACRQLGELGRAAQAAGEKLQDRLNDEDGDVCNAAAAALSEIER